MRSQVEYHIPFRGDGLYQKERLFMEQALIINLDNETVRFTPDGRVSVIDVIRAVSNSNCPWDIWERLRTEHPEILIHCEDYSFLREGPIPGMDSEGLGKIWMLLHNYLLDPNLA
jgi:hypothetical protein